MKERVGRSRAYGPTMSTLGRAILIVLIIALAILSFILIGVLKTKQAENEKLSTKIEELHEANKLQDDKKNELNDAKGRDVSDEEYESLAREELGLIKKDEIIIKPR